MFVLIHALALLAPVPLVDIGWAGCPNVMASEVGASTVETGEATRCGIGISLFGWEIGIGGPLCYPNRFKYPAHQRCMGEVNEGTMCVPDNPIPISGERCECERATIFGTGLLLPECTCTPTLDNGHVEDFKTVLCDEDHRHGPIGQGSTP